MAEDRSRFGSAPDPTRHCWQKMLVESLQMVIDRDCPLPECAKVAQDTVRVSINIGCTVINSVYVFCQLLQSAQPGNLCWAGQSF
jgi:hypothetical protein